jgi:hypothetical protein
MFAQKVVLLDEARAGRARAQHVRTLCQSVNDHRAIQVLTDYADELEKRAADLETTVRGSASRLALPLRDF